LFLTIEGRVVGNYTQLTTWLEQQAPARLRVSFGEIEAVLGRPLPPSAYKYRAWWSNNPDNNVMTRAWRAAGYETAEVDMAGEQLVFQPARQTVDAGKREVGESRPAGVAEMGTQFDWTGALPLSARARAWLDGSTSSADAIAKAIEAAAAR
jgi:hypothetical protein